MITTPTVASLLIDALTPAQRATLNAALDLYIDETTTEKIEQMDNCRMAPTIKLQMVAAFDYCIKSAQEVKQSIFGECFPEDLSMFPFINQALRADKKNAG